MTLARREVGNTGLELSTLGFGGAAIGNLYRELADEDASAAVRESFAAGVRYFDTAPFYGFGLSEVRLGQALQGAQALPVACAVADAETRDVRREFSLVVIDRRGPGDE